MAYPTTNRKKKVKKELPVSPVVIDAQLLAHNADLNEINNQLKGRGIKGSKLNIKTEQDIMLLKGGGSDRYLKKDGRPKDPTQQLQHLSDLENKFFQLMQDAEGKFHLAPGQLEAD